MQYSLVESAFYDSFMFIFTKSSTAERAVSQGEIKMYHSFLFANAVLAASVSIFAVSAR